MISYAQNFEDVLLWRALGNRTEGMYIDIGAQHPVIDSVSKAFYEHGWRGIHVEPIPVYAELLRQDRPDERVIEAAVSAQAGLLRFFDIPDTGLSTANPEIAGHHRAQGWAVREIIVTATPLDDIFELVPDGAFHWLKIDVEGFERQVLEGWRAPVLPWVVVVESTYPNTQTETHAKWEDLLLAKGYSLVHRDGLNRYYVSPEHPNLSAAFQFGPNVFDGFQLADGHWAVSAQRQQLEALHAQAQEREAQFQQEAAQQMQALREAAEGNAEQMRADLSALRHGLLERERAFADQLLALQRESQVHLATARQAHEAREARLQEELAASRQQLEALHAQAQERERAFAAQLADLQTDDQKRLAEAQQAHEAREARLREEAHVQIKTLREALSEYAAYAQTLDDRIAAMQATWWWRLSMLWRRPSNWSTSPCPAIAKGQLDAPPGEAALAAASPQTAQAMHATSPASSAAHTAARGYATHAYKYLDLTLPEQESPAMLIQHITELFALNGRAFVTEAYRNLLSREPDAHGLAYYLGRLSMGYGKAGVIAQLAQSPECRPHDEIKGLKQLITDEQRAGHWFLAAFGRRKRLEKTLRSETQSAIAALAQIDQRLGALHGTMLTQAQQTGSLAQQVAQWQATDVAQTRSSNAGSGLPAETVQQALSEILGREPENADVLVLDLNRSTDELTWLQYIGKSIQDRLLAPLVKAGTPPPKATLWICIDLTSDPAITKYPSMLQCLNTLVAASEYPVKHVLLNGAAPDLDHTEPALKNARAVANIDALIPLVDKNDLILFIKNGDEVRPEIHMALKYFNCFNSDFTITDMYFRDAERIFPLLLHAFDDLHGKHCDYFHSRFAINGRIFKELSQAHPKSNIRQLALEYLSRHHSRDAGPTVHLTIPLICINMSRNDLESARNDVIRSNIALSNTEFITQTDRDKHTSNRDGKVSAVICTKDNSHSLLQLVNCLLHDTAIFEIIIVSNNTSNPYALAILDSIRRNSRINVLRYDKSFNFSAQCNLGARTASGDLLLFLNDDIVPSNNDWLEFMLDDLDQHPRSIIGPLLLYPDQSVQHGGMFMGFNNVAGHTLRHAMVPKDDYNFMLSAPRRVSCLTGAAMLMPKPLFDDLNGFDPNLGTYLQDVDLCLRVIHSQAELIFDPRAILFHMESISIKPLLSDSLIGQTRDSEYAYFSARWGDKVYKDAWHNPQIDVCNEQYRVIRSS